MRWATRGSDTAAAKGGSWVCSEAPVSVSQQARQSSGCCGSSVR
jgi:hypothetical protein